MPSMEAIVTAGLSNYRSASADANYFVVYEEDDGAEDGEQKMTPGTINTIVVGNTPLTPVD